MVVFNIPAMTFAEIFMFVDCIRMSFGNILPCECQQDIILSGSILPTTHLPKPFQTRDLGTVSQFPITSEGNSSPSAGCAMNWVPWGTEMERSEEMGFFAGFQSTGMG